MRESVVGKAREKKMNTRKWIQLVARAKELLVHARTYRETQREGVWTRSEAQYKGKHWGESDDGLNDLITINYSFSTAQTILPYITANDPAFRVEPYSSDAQLANARAQGAFLNRTWRAQTFAGNFHLRRAAFNFVVVGDGWLLPSWSVETLPGKGQFDSKEIARLHLDSISPWDVWIDPESDGAFNARWVIRRVRLSVEALRNDPVYRNTRGLAESSKTGANEDKRGDLGSRRIRTNHPRDQIVDVFEFYDIAARQMIAFTDQSDKPLRIIEDMEFPLVQVKNNEIPNSPYGMGEMEQLWELQQEINKTRSQMVSHRRRNVQKFVSRRGMLGQAAKDALKSETVNEVVEINTDEPLEFAFHALDVPQLSADAYSNYAVTKEDIFEISGVSEYIRGGTPSGRRTATEATIIESASNVKTSHKLRAIEEGARRAGTLLLAFAKEVFPETDTDETALVLTGKEAQAVQQSANIGLDPEDAGSGFQDPSKVASLAVEPNEDLFSGEYEVFVDRGSTELRDPIAREQKFKGMFIDLLQSVEVLTQLGISVNLRKVLEMWFEAAGIDDIDGMFDAQQGGGAGGIPPELLQQLLAGQEGGASPGATVAPGAPNVAAALPPGNAIGPENSGLLGPLS